MAEDINSNLGISRRQLIKRGAIVGGTVMWAAPVVQSMTSPAGAQGRGTLGTPIHACCCCTQPDPADPPPPPNFDCSTNGEFNERANATACRDFCGTGGESGQGRFIHFEYERGGDPGCTNTAGANAECNCPPDPDGTHHVEGTT